MWAANGRRQKELDSRPHIYIHTTTTRHFASWGNERERERRGLSCVPKGEGWVGWMGWLVAVHAHVWPSDVCIGERKKEKRVILQESCGDVLVRCPPS